MEKKLLIKATVFLLIVGITVAALSPLRFPENSAEQWMAELDDSRSISSLSVPGTHDSGAVYSFGGVFGKCQTLGISDQLRIGVRFFDIRLRLVDDELIVYHDFVEQKAKFADVLEELAGYLEENPSEFLIVSLKEEYGPLRSEKQFTKVLEDMLRQYPDVVCADKGLPENVGSARGKIYIIARYADNTMGIGCYEGWENNTSFELHDMYIQDHYKLDGAEEKIPDIEAALDIAASEKYSLVLNFTSCYLSKGYPPSYSGTPAQVINRWLSENLGKARAPLGVMVCDFITSETAMTIIGRNFS